MLDFLGEREAAKRIEHACAQPSTPTGTTTEIGDAIATLVTT